MIFGEAKLLVFGDVACISVSVITGAVRLFLIVVTGDEENV
jgi:hypothetical protein